VVECGSAVDSAYGAARAIATDVSEVLASVADRGQVSLDALLDLTYTEYKGAMVDKLKGLWGDVSRAPRTGFTPPKYATAYDTLVDVPLRAILDQHKHWVEEEPLTTGEVDVRNMRTVHSRREFAAAVGSALREPDGGDHNVLLQTFARHTGTIVNILSVPLYVMGHRYGAIIVGWLPQQ
jgi:methyl-accepting chemotaxis protein